MKHYSLAIFIFSIIFYGCIGEGKKQITEHLTVQTLLVEYESSFEPDDFFDYGFDEVTEHNVSIVKRNRIKSVYELDTDTITCLWHSEDILPVIFKKGNVFFNFSASCGYTYPTQYVDEKKIIFIGEYDEDSDMEKDKIVTI